MKSKLLIAIFLCVGSLSFIFAKMFSEVKPEPAQTITEQKTQLPQSPDEQQKYLDYLLLAKYYKLEFESDFKNIGTGQIIEDNSEFGKGEKVIHCSAGRDKPGYISGAVISGEYGNQVAVYSNDSNHTFYIKQRLRIRKELIMPRIENYNSENLQTNICRLEIINSEGNKISEVEYTARDFLEENPEDAGRMFYSGNYKEGAGGFLKIDSLITVSGKELYKSPKGKSKKGSGKESSKIDFRIYWYGYTDVWLDFIEVKNDVARDLISGRYDAMLDGMNIVSPEKLNEMRASGYPEVCYEYIYKRVFKK